MEVMRKLGGFTISVHGLSERSYKLPHITEILQQFYKDFLSKKLKILHTRQ